MNRHRLFTCHGFSLLELIMVMAIIAIFGIALSLALEGMNGWSAKASAEDELTEDVLTVWKTFNDDLGQSAWWIPDPTQAFSDPSFTVDRGLLYAPFVVQPTLSGAANSGQPTGARMRIFARSGSGDTRFEGPALADLDRLTLPGQVSDRLLSPAAFSSPALYRQSYFARSQELVFVRATNTLWNHISDRPNQVGSAAPGTIQLPIERFPGPTTAWRASANHSTIGALLPSGWQRSGTSWVSIGTGPYGQVMDACYLYGASATLGLRLQLEQQGQPTFQAQDPAQVRLYTYAVVPSPNGRGLGRLVRAYSATPGSTPTSGVNPGQRIASDGATSLIIDRVISDNVTRVLFDTARHADDIGINNVRATVFFAKLSENKRGSNAPLVLRRAVTMVFALRAANSWQDKESARSRIKTTTTIASGAIPFSY